ncbi:hypothetical protein BCR32DRAFT_279933 [Anaeromyces robustus]|uniref:Uncharacterized protein n=1 Tax=Anaeromyces robustus TaxID=1754192 RepID=A0A1Y1X5T3_9FUNG|nr:hypothetical protein BCR32DRAFT_279933 [Anaeromyces robustus]|eukprot:ORX81170.1 hypothetical protein BCR32DRAFT_279933 [Anaeromyces robustus]
MKFYSALVFFILCTMLVLSNPIKSTEETENKLIEKRAKIPQSLIDAVNGVANHGNELGNAVKVSEEEKRKEKCREKNRDDYNNCVKYSNLEQYCMKFQKIVC